MRLIIDGDEYLKSIKPKGISDKVWEESELYKSITNAPTIEPNLVINPDEVERGDVTMIGQEIVVMHYDDYMDMMLKSAAVDDGSWERFAAEPCEDAISREDAIKNIECWKDKVESEQDEYFNLGLWQAIREIKRAPSVAPKHSGEATEMVEDAISIEVAIQTTWMILNGMGYPKDQNEELDQTIKAVFDTAPRIAPSRPQGEWILECDAEGEGDNLYRCSKCGQRCGCQEYDLPNFCPNCGAQMKGATDGNK